MRAYRVSVACEPPHASSVSSAPGRALSVGATLSPFLRGKTDMTIRRFYQPGPRHRIGVVGSMPPPEVERAFELCGYELFEFEGKHPDTAVLATTGAVVFRQSKEKPRRIVQELEAHARELLAHDCHVFVELADPTASPVAHAPGMREADLRLLVVDAFNRLQLPLSGLSEGLVAQLGTWFKELHPDGMQTERLAPLIHVLANRDARPHLREAAVWQEVLEALRLTPPGPAPGEGLRIEAIDHRGRKLKLDDEKRVLVARAFHDCDRVKLIEVTNGLSSALTLRAFAHLRVGQVGGSWPYLFFAKLGPRSKISREFLAYQETALENIPFHLGPRLRLDRCALAGSQGIIVSDYVTDAEALRDCARDGRAVGPIASLFNVTLRAWQSSARTDRTSLRAWLLPHLEKIVVPPHRKRLLAEYGSKLQPKDFKDRLPDRVDEQVVVGAIHGDLHATNVLVRGADAILIDFEKVGPAGPLLWDLASLEGGLFVDGFVGDRRTAKSLLRSVRDIYTSVDVMAVTSCHPSEGSAWFFACVRQVRMRARELERARGQYAATLAVVLMRKGCNPEKFTSIERKPGLSREDLRAMAYVVAEWALDAACKQAGNT
jgi:hypothetical protein